MDSLISYLNACADGFISSYAWPVIWQSSLLALVVALATRSVFRKASPQFKYLLWLLVIVRLFLPPSLYLPTGISNWGPVLVNRLPLDNQQVVAPPIDQPLEAPPAFGYSAGSYANGPGISSSIVQPINAPVKESLHAHALLCLAWMIGVVMLVVLARIKLMRLVQMRRRSEQAPRHLTTLVERYARLLKIRHRFTVCVTDELASPVVCGLFRPTIIFPRRVLKELSEDELEPVIIHELAHIKRYDWLVNWVQTFAAIMYFFNPFLWLANRQIRVEREKACDDVVLVTLDLNRKGYVQSLLKVLPQMSPRPVLMPGFIGIFERRSSLASRMVRILDRNVRPAGSLRLVSILGLTAFSCCFLTFRANAARRATNNESLFTHTLQGRVVNEQNEPVGGAVIHVISRARTKGATGELQKCSMAPAKPIRSDVAGAFSITGLTTEKVTFKTVSHGYKDREFTADSNSQDFKVVLKRISDEGMRYEVNCVDKDGRPVPDARLRLLMDIQTDSSVERITQDALTDKQGIAKFHVEGPGGKFAFAYGNIVFDNPGYDLAIAFIAASKDENIDFVVHKPGKSWRARVLDQAGKPIAGARVRIGTWEGRDGAGVVGMRKGGPLELSYQTDQDGWFELSRFSNKDKISVEIVAPFYHLQAACLDPETGYTYVGGWPIERIRKSRNTGGVFRLTRGGDVRGKVIVKETGKPPAQPCRISVTGILKKVGSRPPKTYWVPVEQDGSFSLPALQSFSTAFGLDTLKPQERARVGKNELSWKMSFSSVNPANSKLVWPSPIAFDVKPGQTKEVVVELTEGSLVKAKLINGRTGKLFSGRLHGTITRPGKGHRQYESVGSDGTWAVYLPPGEFQVQFVDATAGEQGPLRTIRVKAGETLDLGSLTLNLKAIGR
ncbi:MAG: M48 family metalloprotease [Phycisphaerales bacterium]|nr:MAG: M48 family metalloprotease [Phycisphaerales bacterium]